MTFQYLYVPELCTLTEQIGGKEWRAQACLELGVLRKEDVYTN